MLKRILLCCVISLWALGDAGVLVPPGWEKPTGYAGTMSLIARVLSPDGSRYVETPGSVLAAFDAQGMCRGMVEGKSGSGGFLYRLSIASNQSAEAGLSLKILDARAGEVFDIRESIDFVKDAVVGTTENPRILHVKPHTLELSIPLVQNWNWISFNVEQGERTLDGFLADYAKHATNDDILKSSTDFATFYNGHWDPEAFRIEPGKMYLLRKQKAGHCVVTVEGLPSDPTVPIPLVKGWNWLGYTGSTPATLQAMFHPAGFQNNDILKSSTDFSTFYNGVWDGDVTLTPGTGYLLRQNVSGQVDFRNASSNPAE